MPGATRRFSVFLALVGVVLTILLLTQYRTTAQDTLSSLPSKLGSKLSTQSLTVDDDVLKGHAIAPKLGNETAKYVTRTRLHLQNRVADHDCPAEPNSAAQHGSCSTPPLRGFPISLRRTRARRSRRTYTCFKDCIPGMHLRRNMTIHERHCADSSMTVANAQVTSVRSSTSTHRKFRRGPLPLLGAAMFIIWSIRI